MRAGSDLGLGDAEDDPPGAFVVAAARVLRTERSRRHAAGARAAMFAALRAIAQSSRAATTSTETRDRSCDVGVVGRRRVVVGIEHEAEEVERLRRRGPDS